MQFPQLYAAGDGRIQRYGKTFDVIEPRVVSKAEATPPVLRRWRPIYNRALFAGRLLLSTGRIKRGDTMRAVVITKHGDISVLQTQERPGPPPAHAGYPGHYVPLSAPASPDDISIGTVGRGTGGTP